MPNATSRIPRYHQIAEALRDRIDNGFPAPGERLDDQRSLAREFGVTLMTLRQALDLLDRDGLITRRHGLGTFVSAPVLDYDILNFRTLAGDLSATGKPVLTRFLRSHFTAGDAQVTRALGVAEGARVFVLERLRLVRGRPMSFQASHLTAAVGRDASKLDLALIPLRQALAFKLGIEITAARESVAAVQLDARAARELGCRAGIPAFRSDRVSVGAGRRARRVRSRLHSRGPIPDHSPTALQRIPDRGAQSMKILVMVKQVPDTATQVKIGGDGAAIDSAGVTWIVSPYDEFAVEEALRIKEKRGQGEVVAVSLGPARAKEALRSCLAMGADRAIHLLDPRGSRPTA